MKKEKIQDVSKLVNKFSINDFLIRAKKFNHILSEKWLEPIDTQISSLITINISQEVIKDYSILSLGDKLSSIAVCRSFNRLRNIKNANILWYVKNINYEDCIKENWNECHSAYCHDLGFSLTKLRHFINDFFYIDNICKQEKATLWWYTDDKYLKNILNTRVLHKFYLNNNTFYKNKSQLDGVSQFRKESNLIKMWLEQCSNK